MHFIKLTHNPPDLAPDDTLLIHRLNVGLNGFLNMENDFYFLEFLNEINIRKITRIFTLEFGSSRPRCLYDAQRMK